MIQLRIFLGEWLGMQGSSLLLKIWKGICKCISIKEYYQMEQESILRKLFRLSIQEEMDFPMKTEGHSVGTRCPFKPILHAELSSLSTPSDTQGTPGPRSGQTETSNSLWSFSPRECIRPRSTP